MLQLRDWYDDLSAFLLGDWSMAGAFLEQQLIQLQLHLVRMPTVHGHLTNGQLLDILICSAKSILILTQGVIVAPPVAVIENIGSRPAQLPLTLMVLIPITRAVRNQSLIIYGIGMKVMV